MTTGEDKWIGDYMVDEGYEASRRYDDVESHDPVTKDVAFIRHSTQDGKHVSPFDNGRILVGADELRIRLVQGLDLDAFKETLARAQQATTGVEPDVPMEAQWEELLEGGLQTALETQVIVFEVAGASRCVTHQLVRTRKASFHQQSQRATFYGERPEVRMPESIWRNRAARLAFLKAMRAAHEAYNVACDEDIAYQDARFILPEGTTNYILLEYPLREFLNVYAYRACSMFMWEHVAIMRECRRQLVERYPFLEKHVKISCEKTRGALDKPADGMWFGGEEAMAHHCTFQGWEQVEHQCDFPWARESNRAFRSKHYEIRTGAK